METTFASNATTVEGLLRRQTPENNRPNLPGCTCDPAGWGYVNALGDEAVEFGFATAEAAATTAAAASSDPANRALWQWQVGPAHRHADGVSLAQCCPAHEPAYPVGPQPVSPWTWAQIIGRDWPGRDFSGQNFGPRPVYVMPGDTAGVWRWPTLPTSFAMANLAGANFTNAQLERCGFEGADCTEANFAGADLTSAGFWESTILAGADFTGAKLDYVNWGGADTSSAIGLPAKATS